MDTPHRTPGTQAFHNRMFDESETLESRIGKVKKTKNSKQLKSYMRHLKRKKEDGTITADEGTLLDIVESKIKDLDGVGGTQAKGTPIAPGGSSLVTPQAGSGAGAGVDSPDVNVLGTNPAPPSGVGMLGPKTEAPPETDPNRPRATTGSGKSGRQRALASREMMDEADQMAAAEQSAQVNLASQFAGVAHVGPNEGENDDDNLNDDALAESIALSNIQTAAQAVIAAQSNAQVASASQATPPPAAVQDSSGNAGLAANAINATTGVIGNPDADAKIQAQTAIDVARNEFDLAHQVSGEVLGGQTSITPEEAKSLQYEDYVKTYGLAPRLLREAERGNLGAGTSASGPVADLWGVGPKANPVDKRPDGDTQSRRITVGESGQVSVVDDREPPTKILATLPYVKLNGKLMWVPRHMGAAMVFFNSFDYDELRSMIVDSNPLSLQGIETINEMELWKMINDMYLAMRDMCKLNTPLPLSASREQVYGEWLELKQMATAVYQYQTQTAGFYQNRSISIGGGIRAAVSQAIGQTVQSIAGIYDGSTLEEQDIRFKMKRAAFSLMHADSPDLSRKRPLTDTVHDGVVEFNPQFKVDKPDFKVARFSVPVI